VKSGVRESAFRSFARVIATPYIILAVIRNQVGKKFSGYENGNPNSFLPLILYFSHVPSHWYKKYKLFTMFLSKRKKVRERERERETETETNRERQRRDPFLKGYINTNKFFLSSLLLYAKHI